MYRFSKTIEAHCSEKTVRKLFEQTPWGDVQYGLHCTDPEKLFFEVRTKELLVCNSFQPHFRLTVEEEKTLTQIHITAEIKTPTRVAVLAYSAMCIAFQLAMFIMWFCGRLDASFVMLIPSGLFLFANLFAFLGLRLSARPFLKEVSRLFDVDYPEK